MPKLFRVLGIFVIIWLIRVHRRNISGFVRAYPQLHLKDLKHLMDQERRLDKYMENTQSRNSEIVTNIKTVKAFAEA